MSFERMLGGIPGADTTTHVGDDFVCSQCGWRPARSKTAVYEGVRLNATMSAKCQYLIHSITRHADETRRQKLDRVENDRFTDDHLKRLRASGAPESSVAMVMGSATPNAACAGAVAFDDASQILCLFTGDTGCGKSTGAVLWLRLRLAETTGVYVHVPTLFGMFGSLDEQRTRLREAQRARALVLDDVGRETKSESTQGVLHQLLLYRHDNGLKTLVTSNYGEEVFLARYDLGGALTDRFKSSGLVVNCGTESMRRKT